MYFIKEGKRECFSAMLYTCYDLLKPDWVMEVSWRNGFGDIAMPFMVQFMAEYVGKVDALEREIKERGVRDDEKEKADLGMMAGGMGNLMLTQGGGGGQGQGGFNGGY
jgi:clathrin heavy chain